MNIDIEKFDGTLDQTDQYGNDIVFDMLDWIKWNNREYVVVTADNYEPGEIVILQVVSKDDGSDSFIAPENEDDEQIVFDMFMNRLTKLVSLRDDLFD